MNKKTILLIIFLTCVVWLSPGNLLAFSPKPLKTKNYYSELKPTKEHSKTNREIIKDLQKLHYRQQEINDELSLMVFDSYLKALDPEKLYFLSKDIKEFKAYSLEFDDALKSGDLAPAMEMFNLYHKYMIERIIYTINYLEKGIENIRFDIDESIIIDRKEEPWPKNKKERTDLWRKRLKNTILSLKLSSKPGDEIKEILLKRYKNRLNKMQQFNNEDAFQLYMNSVTQIYGPHTQYFSPRDTENFNINMSLSLEGIGAVLQSENEYTKVKSLVAGGPAEKSKNLHAGDRISGVGQGEDGKIVDVIGWRIDDVVELIRGPKDTVVRLEIIPSDAIDEHKTKIINIVRNKVKLEEMAAKKRVMEFEKDGNSFKVGIIDIPAFYMDFSAYHAGDPDFKSTTRDVKKLINELTDEKVDGIVVDLRNNGGGSLQEANDLTGLFIRQGPTVQIKNTKGKIEILGDMDSEISYRGPLMVLVNRMSASASEIFAGAIQDYQRGIVVGGQTFGKGTVQSLISLDRGQLKITTAKFYRVSGESTQHKGVIPDISFPSFFDPMEDGESAMPNPLPWDKIDYVPHNGCLNLTKAISKLEKMHQKRILSDPDFNYLVKKIEYYKSEKEQNILSINQEVRKKEFEDAKRWQLDIENSRRKAKGQEPIEKIEDLEKKSNEENEDQDEDNSAEKDTLLTETTNIMIDFLSMKTLESYSQFIPLSRR
jgi:carboxyl-terminal processing protease